MTTRVIMVHDDPTCIERALSALREAHYDAVAFTDPMAALDALDAVPSVARLITRVVFSPGTPNGVALARMVRLRQPPIPALFIARPETREHVRDLGEFLPMPISGADLVT